VRVWRLCPARHAADPLGGRGGLFVSGRWHPRGVRVVYTSSSLSLAVLEVLVHAGRDTLPDDLLQIEIEVPDDLPTEVVDDASLSASTPGWRSYPAPRELQAFGEAWLREGRTPLLRVPSAVVPEEWNLLINPAHPQASGAEAVTVRRFGLDPRLRR
jgi:RES domain-containing protein